MTIGMAAIRLSMALLAAWLWLGAAAFAQESGSKQAAETADKLQALSGQERTDLIAHLDDAQVRDLLLFYLGKTAPAPAAAASPDRVLESVEKSGQVIRRNIVATVASVRDVPAALGTAFGKLAGERGILGIILLAIALVVFVGIGYAAERLYSIGVARIRGDLRARAASAAEGGMLASATIFLLDLVGIAVFAAGYVLAFLAVWQDNVARRHLAAAVLAAIVLVRFVRSAGDFLFSPESAGPRLIPLDSAGARYFRDYSVRIAIVAVATLIPAFLIGIWHGDPYVRSLLVIVGGAVFVGYFAAVIWGGRQHAANALLAPASDGAPPPFVLRLLARSWGALIAGYAIVLFLATIVAAMAEADVSALSFLGALLIVAVGIPVADSLVGLALSRRSRGAAAAGEPSAPHPNRIFRRAARIVVAVLAALLVLHFLGVDFVAVASQSLGGWLVRLVFNVGVTVLIAYVLWELAIAAINRKLAEDSAAHGAHGALDTSAASRLSTLLPLFRRALQGAILAIAGLMVLSSLGVDIGPMLAGAGIVGLAVGFGAQTLVKDLISGLFFLLDDAFRIGEYIEVGSVGGNVERINTRSLSLRTPEGAVHTVPFGSLDAVANYSRDWAIVKMEFKVTYDTDLAKVKKIFRGIGDELSKDAELAPGFIQPFKFQGVKAMDETGIIVRGKFMAVPGTQFQIRKQVFERVQKAFADEGISFAQRHVQVDLPPGLERDASTKEAVTRAAAAALATETPPAPKA